MDEREEKIITRREVVTLAGIAAALGAGLGVAHSADAQVPGMIQDKHRPGMMLFKFYSYPDAGKQMLLGSMPVPAVLQHKFSQMAGGRLQLKLEIGSTSALLPAVQKPAILAESVLQFKQTSRAIRNPIRR